VKIFNDAGVASLSVIHLGFQWLLDPDGDPDTNDAPDVVNNSWGFDQNPNECIPEFQPDVQALKTAEIDVVFSGGNTGPYAPSSVSPANYPESFAVGAVDNTLTVAYFSGRGPLPSPPSACNAAIYPDVVAPGVGVKTSDLQGYADNEQGTSIAAPQVSGVMALLIEAFPCATVSEVEEALKSSAVDLGDMDDYGYGLIDSLEAYNALSSAGIPEGTDDDGDGYFIEGGNCGAVDCDDSDPDIYPRAPEIKHDDIDQDCNGYDLTIDIIKADYAADRDILTVEATSALGKDAGLELTGYGSMSWDRKKAKWKITVRGAGGDPGTVTVSGIEGDENGPTVSDGGGDPVGVEGKGQTCTDGIDNDGDGSIDCDDSDCSKNKACK
jgi:bacillopeptidase F